MSASLKDYVSDLELILQKSKISKDFRVNRRHLQFLWAQYRALAIRQQFAKTNEIDPTWLQDMGPTSTTQVTSADDPLVLVSSVTLSKITIPTIAQLNGANGVWRIASASKQETFFPITQARFFSLVQDSYRYRFCYYFRVGPSLYVNKIVNYLDPILILDDPMDGTIIDTTNQVSGDLVVGTQYVVSVGTIVHNGVQYNIGQTFTAANATFTTLGPFTGAVQLVNQVRPFALTDPYPMSFTMAEMIKLKILTQDFKIEESQLAEIRNDSQDQTVLDQGQSGK
jgi:hypothetical protein